MVKVLLQGQVPLSEFFFKHDQRKVSNHVAASCELLDISTNKKYKNNCLTVRIIHQNCSNKKVENYRFAEHKLLVPNKK